MVSTETRTYILGRDQWVCQDCGEDLRDEDAKAEVHHITPRSEGGSDDYENLIALCRSCHGARHASKEGGEEGRALLTEAERDILSGEKDVSDNYEYKVQSLVRNRVRKKLGDDLDVLREHFPEVYEMIVEEIEDATED